MIQEEKSGGFGIGAGIAIGIIIALICVCLVVFGVGSSLIYVAADFLKNLPSISFEPQFEAPAQEPTPIPEINRPSVDDEFKNTQFVLGDSVVPENNPYDLACRLQNICGVSETVDGKSYSIGDKELFWISNSDTAEQEQITATLMYETSHSYFWVEEGTSVNKAEMKRLMDTFEEKIYPTDREFFGSEWNPGVDGDEHIYVLYATSIGHNIAGYFSPINSYNPLVKEFSNAHETYVLGTSQDLGDDYTYSTLAHEFVHMIQFASDRNDVSWLSEGFAEVGSFINGYDMGGADWIYVQKPDMQLTTWVDNSNPDFSAHYGQSFLYLAYFLDRFGEDASKALTSNPENDITSVDDTLADLNIADPKTGAIITADDVFMDWAAALLLMDGSVDDGRYTYNNYPSAPQPIVNDLIFNCPAPVSKRAVYQYGIDYISIQCSGNYTLEFTGSTVVGLLPVEPHSGKYAFWSNRGDESDMTLTREFDFTNVPAPIELKYNVWYDLEEDYDYVFLEVSEDGEKWEILSTPSGTAENPSGNSYGWGYNGKTNDWIEEKIDLSAYAGKKIQIRFEYVTDAAQNGEGFLLDDVEITAADYRSGFEADDGGWQAAGFVRVQNDLPQTFRLALVTKSGNTIVKQIPVNEDQTASTYLSLDAGDQAILIVTGTTRFTRQPASYQIEIK